MMLDDIESDVDDLDNDPTYETGSGDYEDATDDSTLEEEVAPEKNLPHIRGEEYGEKNTSKRKSKVMGKEYTKKVKVYRKTVH